MRGRRLRSAGDRCADAGLLSVAAWCEERLPFVGLLAEVDRELGERRRAEDALRASEHSYRLLFEENPRPMWLYDPDTLAFLEVNDAAVSGYGYSRDQFRTIRLHVPSGARRKWRLPRRRAIPKLPNKR